MDSVQSQLGNAIREARLGLGLSQEYFAAQCGLHRTYIGSVERGERNVSLLNIALICKALGFSAAELMTRAGL